MSISASTVKTFTRTLASLCVALLIFTTGTESKDNDNLARVSRGLFDGYCFFDNQLYSSGYYYIANGCAKLYCNGNTGDFSFSSLLYQCRQCRVWWDPHVYTFDAYSSLSYVPSYAYNTGCGKFSLSQSDSSYNPKHAVYATFRPCYTSQTSPTCVDSVNFKEGDNTYISVSYTSSSNYQVLVNGYSYNVGSNPSSVRSYSNGRRTVHPVLAWRWYNSDKRRYGIMLLGSSGILVQFTGDPYNVANEVKIYVYYSNIVSSLRGLCGSPDHNVNNDFTNRWRRTWSPYTSWYRWVPNEFATSWLVNGNGICSIGRKRRQAQNGCDTDPSIRENFNKQCNNTIQSQLSDVNEEPKIIRTLTEACVYDLCNVTDPTEWMKSIEATVKLDAEIKKITIEDENVTIPTDAPTSEPVTLLPETTKPAPTATTKPTTKPPTTSKPAPPTTRKPTTKPPTTTKPAPPTTTKPTTKPPGCEGNELPKCTKRKGYCINLKTEKCKPGEKNRKKYCEGEDCTCCFKGPKPCKIRKPCIKRKGKCLKKKQWDTCEGILNEKWCRPKRCACCVPIV